MDFRSWLRRRILLIIVGLLVFAGLVYGVTIWAGSEDARYVVVASAALVAATIAILTLFITYYDLQIRVRPFVTVSGITEMASMGPSGQSEAPYYLNGCFINIQNSGSVPANKLNVGVTLAHKETGQIAKELRTGLHFLPPTVTNTVHLSDVPNEVQPQIWAGEMKIEVSVQYEALGKSYETTHTFDIAKSGLPLGASIFEFRQVDPSRWS